MLDNLTKEQKIVGGVGLLILLALLSGKIDPRAILNRHVEQQEESFDRSLDERLHAVMADGHQADAKKDAVRAAALCEALAKRIEFDAGRADTERKLRIASKVEELRIQLREHQLEGGSYERKYPGFGATVRDCLAVSLTDADADLSADDERRTAREYRALGEAFTRVSERL